MTNNEDVLINENNENVLINENIGMSLSMKTLECPYR